MGRLKHECLSAHALSLMQINSPARRARLPGDSVSATRYDARARASSSSD